MNVFYKYDNNAFRTYGVFVSGSDGIIGMPERKAPNKYEYPDESGYVPDLSNVIYEAREIDLTCFIKAATAEELISKYEAFTALLSEVKETKTLSITVGTKSLSFEVFCQKIGKIKKTFTKVVNVGTFTIKFIEPDTSIYETTDNT